MTSDAVVGYADGLSPEELAFQRLWGPWQQLTPAEARALLDPLGMPWWVAGGYAIEAFTGVPRHHEDIDVSILRRDLPGLAAGLSGRYHVWAAGPDGLTPLADERMELPARADQVWLREHALAPWRVDVLLSPDRDGRWVSRRDRAFDAPVADVTFERDGVRYLRPEHVLAFKAKACRPKDEADFAAASPLLDESARGYLAGYLREHHPDHPWLGALSDA